MGVLKEPRKLRADALRNRERILAVAREAFAEGGASVTLEDIVRLSGLGTGTLYRHFPTRDALMEALYLSEMEKLAAAERELSATLPPVEALREWMRLFVDLMATKLALKEALNAMVCGPEDLYAASGEMIRTAITTLTDRAVAAGEIRLEIEPLDLLRALAGVANASPGADWKASARRMVDMLIAGMKPS
ncbi:TetR/AcrR family transcriptional regulator [bacterium]|nr:MAG: TetR/AcrR family transcriptional regulator [bacterium]